LICVFGAPGGRNQEIRPLLGRAAERHADLLIITSDNPAGEAPLEIAHDILDGCSRPGAPHILPDRARAIQWALHEAREGDTVLIAGKGCDNGQQIGDCVYPFDDREATRYCLYQLVGDKTR
jgi:UDP-N-acetylmuramoyl-L-alanyl-D-glutamate--2,6-diaminopimelate ligase